MGQTKITIALIWTTFVLIASSTNAEPADPDCIATWREGTISSPELSSWLDFQRKGRDEVDIRAACEDLLLVKVLATETQKLGVDAETRQKIDSAVDTLLTKRLRRYIADEIEVSDEEIEAAFQKSPDAYQVQQRLRLRNLFLSFPPGATEVEKEETRTAMAKLIRRLDEGADFGELAELESHSQTRFHKGLMGNVAPGQLPKSIEEIAQALSPGEISRVIEMSDGLTILKCDRIIPAKSPSPDEVKARLAKILRKNKETENWRSLEVKLGFRVGESTNPRFNRAAANHAKALGLNSDPEVVATINWTRLRFLAAEGLRRRVFAEMTIPNERDIRRYYEANPEEFMAPETFVLSAIRLEFNDEDFSSVHQNAKELSYKLRNGLLEFNEAAGAVSADGPNLILESFPPMTRRQLASRGPEFIKTVVNLRVQQIGREFASNGSLWILRLDAHNPRKILPFDKIEDQAHNQLAQQGVTMIQDSIEADIRNDLNLIVIE